MTLRSTFLLLLLALLVAAGSVVPARAATNKEWESYKGWEIKSFAVEGLPKEMKGDLTKGLAQTGKWKLLTGTVRPEFSVRTLAEDLVRIRLYLAQNGFPAATVQPVVAPNSQTRQLDLVLQVTLGPPVRIGRIEMEGWPEGVVPPDADDAQNLAVGEIVVDEKVEKARAHLEYLLLDAGYAEVVITSKLLPVALETVAVHYLVVPGDPYKITEVEIVGCSDDLMKIAHRVLNISPGVDYSRELITNASLDLRGTQLFNMVVLETTPVGPGQLKLTATLGNGRMKTLEAGVGTYTDNPWLVRAGWGHRNLFKNGVGLDVAAVVGTYRLGIGTGVNWLGVLSPRARTRLGIGFLVEDEDAYRSDESRAELVQSFRPRRRDIWNVGLSVSHTDVNRKNPEATDVPEEQGRLLELWTDVRWDRTSDPLFPKDGWYFKTSFTVAPPGFFSEIPYVSVQCDASAYRAPLDPVVFAGRIRVGWAKPLGEAQSVLATRRFYGGGYNTHRGYDRRKLGPLDAAGDALGGEFIGLAGLEMRFPLVWKIDGAFFADAGQVWEIPEYATLRGLPLAVGFSLDLRTPLGPVRGGYGWNVLNQIEGQPRHIFHFGIGYPW